MTQEVWERHPVYPHEGSSLGRARTLKGRILAQRPNNRPEEAPPEHRYRLMDVWMPRPPCYQENGKWVHLKPGCKCRETVSVHVFITECHWGLKKYRRQVARHRVSAGGGAADNRWENLLGWGWPEDNEADKPPEVRIAAAKTARAAQLPPPPRMSWWRRAARHLPWSPTRPPARRITAGSRTITKPVTKEVL
jgi:hypothetical protein